MSIWQQLRQHLCFLTNKKLDSHSVLTMEEDVDTNCLRVCLYDRKDPIIFPHTEEVCVEDICLKIAKDLNITSLTFPLFGLVDQSYKNWLSPEKKILPSSFTSQKLFFRVRFSVYDGSELQTLKLKDLEFIKYFYHQCSQDFTQEILTTLYRDGRKLSKEECMGMAVVERLCFAKINNIDAEKLDKNSFITKIPMSVRNAVCRKLNIFESTRFKHNFFQKIKELDAEEENAANLFLRMICGILSYVPNYLFETYDVRVEHHNNYMDDRTILITPNKEIECIGRLQDIHFLELRKNDNSNNEGFEYVVHIFSDKKPKSFLFKKLEVAESFASALNGYYRLSINYYLCLSPKMVPPSLQCLNNVQGHGPLSMKRCKSLLWKRKRGEGSYIVCLSDDTCDYSKLKLVYRKPGYLEIGVLNIEALSEGGFRFKDEDRTAVNLLTLLLEDERTSDLINAVDRGVGDGLLLCQNDKMMHQGVNREVSNSILVSMKEMSVTDTRLGSGCYTEVWLGNMVSRNRQNERAGMAIKILRQDQKHMPECIEFFMRAAGELQQMRSEFIVQLRGLCLNPPTKLILELANEDLEKYLQDESKQIQPYQIVHAMVSLMKALYHLSKESIGLAHGNVRCRNVLVFATQDSVDFKLTDPGMAHLYNALPLQHPCNQERLAWLGPELHQNLHSITHQSDLYSLGTTVWEMWALGSHPPNQRFSEDEEFPIPPALNHCALDIENTDEIRSTIKKLIYACHMENPQHRTALPQLLRDALSLINIASQRPCLRQVPQAIDGCDSICLDVHHPPSLEGFSFSGEQWCFHTPGENSAEHTAQQLAGSSAIATHCAGGRSQLGRPLPNVKVHQREVDIMIGRDRVTKQELLGQGNFGMVYKAQLQTSNGVKPCAMKTLKPESQGAGSDTSLEEEMRVMCNLSHENVVELYGFCISSGNDPLCLLMEFVEKGSLEKSLLASRNLGSLEQSSLKHDVLYSICKDVALGMMYLASKKVVHRDLAARNVLLTANWQAKITDFGLARVLGEGDYYRTRNQQELPVSYYAPEAVGHQRFTMKSDVWTYGILLWEIYTRGKRPNLSKTNKPEDFQRALFDQLSKGERLPKPLNCPEKADHLMRKMCWMFEPDDRPPFNEIVRFFHNHRNWNNSSSC